MVHYKYFKVTVVVLSRDLRTTMANAFEKQTQGWGYCQPGKQRPAMINNTNMRRQFLPQTIAEDCMPTILHILDTLATLYMNFLQTSDKLLKFLISLIVFHYNY